MSDKNTSIEKRKIKFNFHPFKIQEKQNAVEKADSDGNKRRYIRGISSGIKTDAHNEKMTPDCIKSFMEQAESGDILLYPDVHGIKASEDVGILTKAEVLPNGDWFTEYRLFDNLDNIGQHKLEKIDDIWKQCTGQKPYSKPKQKGFSIEGFIPEDGIISADKDEYGNMSNRVINNVMLDGVVLVPRPAYTDSIANACYKALGEMHPKGKQTLQKSVSEKFKNIVEDEEIRDKFFQKKWQLANALEETVEDIMKKNEPEKKDQLNLAFDEYKEFMIDAIMQSESIFINESDEDENINTVEVTKSNHSQVELLKGLLLQLQTLKKNINVKGGHKNVKKTKK